jgi:hypothetical protein
MRRQKAIAPAMTLLDMNMTPDEISDDPAPSFHASECCIALNEQVSSGGHCSYPQPC